MPRTDDLFLAGKRSEFLYIDVHREDGTQRIQGRADSADQCGGQYGQYQPHHAYRK